MAKIAYGVLVSNARGKVGGGVYTESRSGTVLRLRVIPKNPRSEGQLAVRSYLTDAARAFKGLSEFNLALWENYAQSITKHQSVSGQAYHPSPINEFVRLTAKFLQITPGGTIPEQPPTTPYEPDPITVSAVGGVGKITFSASANQVTGSKTEILLQKLPSANRKPAPNGYRTKTFWTASSSTPLDVADLSAGIYVPAYRFCKVATGETGTLHVLPQVTVT